jgi:predicted outer membrane repeat protein
VESAATFNATNNTFSGNTAGNNGGAILNQATITLTSNTITGNSATIGGGGIANYGAAATLNNNIVALNTASFGWDLLGDGFVFGNPYTGTYNLIGNADSSTGLNTPTNMWGTTESALDPKLGPLQNNGGPSQTHALLFDSPVLDQGNAPGLFSDQRGYLRPINNPLIADAGDGSDIGAFEFALSPSAASVSVGGRIVFSKGSGIANARIVLIAADGESWTALSNPLGYFEFEGVPAGATYLINVSHKRYSFDSQTLTLSESVEDLMFFSN